MLTAVSGYYNGSQIVMDEELNLQKGQKVIITVLERAPEARRTFNLNQYMGRGEKMFDSDAGDYVRGLRADDRS